MADSKKYNGSTWQHSLRKLTTATDTFTTFPVDVYSDGNNATVSISGNTVQSGTPTPDNPIMPQGCGDKTGNLAYGRIDGVNIGTNGTIFRAGGYDIAIGRVESGVAYTISSYVLAFYTDEPTIDSMSYDGSRIVGIAGTPTTFTAPITGYVAFRLGSGEQAMLNTGNTPLPYKPYGIEIPISSAGTTTPVYLGEVETTRRIKKYVFDGTENWAKGDYPPSGSYQFGIPKNVYFPDAKSTISNGETFCTHFINRQIAGGLAWGINFNIYMLISDLPEDATADDFKAFLAAQYAAGTPVTVWYVLASETTGIVNEPLMKIGDYADEVLGITVPTITGKDAFDVDTALKPSEVSLSYNGWHDATVKEKSDNLFDYNNPLDKIDNVYISTNGTIEAATLYYTCKIQAIENGTYTYRFAESSVFTSPTVGFYDSSDTLLSVAQHNADVSYFSFITPVNCAYMRVSIFKRTEQEAMLNSGSTALPYEPYWK